MQCSNCQEPMPEDDAFCETCGSALSATPAASPGCPCGAGAEEIGEDGYCQQCGRRAHGAASDHVETELSPDFAAVSDKGLRHARNEDRFAIRGADGRFALVVCDGVSGSRESEEASASAAESVAGDIAAGFDITEAISAAQESLAARWSRRSAEGTPSTTIVAAVVEGGVARIAWVGDSRAYWIGPSIARQLTVDHSWINSVVAAGKLTPEEAGRAPQAHGITRWLGADAGGNAAADATEFAISEPGILLLCSDGLWNHASTPQAMTEAFRRAAENASGALAIGRKLVDFAIDAGGHDNITVAVLRVAATEEPEEKGDV